MKHSSDVFVADAGGVAGSTAGVYTLVLNANGKKLRIRRIEVSQETAGSVVISRALASGVSGGAAVTEANLNGEGSGLPTAVATKGTRTSDHTVGSPVTLEAQTVAADVPVLWIYDHLEFRLSELQALCIKQVVTTNDDLCYAHIEWEEL
jgi:hypothetical protein